MADLTDPNDPARYAYLAAGNATQARKRVAADQGDRRSGDDDISNAPVPATTDDKPPGNREDRGCRLEY